MSYDILMYRLYMVVTYVVLTRRNTPQCLQVAQLKGRRSRPRYSIATWDDDCSLISAMFVRCKVQRFHCIHVTDQVTSHRPMQCYHGRHEYMVDSCTPVAYNTSSTVRQSTLPNIPNCTTVPTSDDTHNAIQHTQLVFLNIFIDFLLSNAYNPIKLVTLIHKTLCSTQPAYIHSLLNYHPYPTLYKH